MCRFVAYLGQSPILLSRLLEAPKNSLIRQSNAAQLANSCLNADGFGVAWYTPEIDPFPAVFRSVRPAWNDTNLVQVARKTKSHCVFGHVRAATLGGVSLNNCHPFVQDTFSFVHNGHFEHFMHFRRTLLGALDDAAFHHLSGNTDSEHFFALWLSELRRQAKITQEAWRIAFLNALGRICAWQQPFVHLPRERGTQLNAVLTDGNGLLAARYVATSETPPLSLYYAQGSAVADSLNLDLNRQEAKYVLIASEPLDGAAAHWQPLPLNHLLQVHPDLSITLSEIVLPS